MRRRPVTNSREFPKATHLRLYPSLETKSIRSSRNRGSRAANTRSLSKPLSAPHQQRPEREFKGGLGKSLKDRGGPASRMRFEVARSVSNTHQKPCCWQRGSTFAKAVHPCTTLFAIPLLLSPRFPAAIPGSEPHEISMVRPTTPRPVCENARP
jgi:hypothetical protein